MSQWSRWKFLFWQISYWFISLSSATTSYYVASCNYFSIKKRSPFKTHKIKKHYQEMKSLLDFTMFFRASSQFIGNIWVIYFTNQYTVLYSSVTVWYQSIQPIHQRSNETIRINYRALLPLLNRYCFSDTC